MDKHVCLSGRVDLVDTGPPTPILAMVKAGWKDAAEIRSRTYIDEIKISVTYFSSDSQLSRFMDESIKIEGVLAVIISEDEVIVTYSGDDKEILTKIGELL